jgi:hypothetical protein
MVTSYRENMSFEAEVRRIAEAVWDLQAGNCQPMHYSDDPTVRELDGLARLRDVTHLIMATTSTRLEKVKGDVKKLMAAETIERTSAPAVSKWLITQTQLDAQHIELARKSNVIALTLEQFQRRFFDSGKYLSLRNKTAFGSARDPYTDSITISDDVYIELPMKIIADSRKSRSEFSSRSISLNQIVNRLIEGESIVMRAPFGSGKSLTTRQIYRLLSNLHRKNSSSPVPLALNLREHWGEDYSDEILDRHARSIGYAQREDLVVAWRAGMCCLLLDGFDEVAAQTVVRMDNKNFMKEARRRALQGVRDFTQKRPAHVGMFLCGRDHYFDDINELSNSLGLAGHPYLIIDLEEFTESSASQFLQKNGISDLLPDWLPRKPLILSYLLRAKLFDSILKIDSSKGFGYAWDNFLSSICAREASLESASMDPTTIRSVLERLADNVRSKSSGTGPITGNDLADAYLVETNQAAGEGVLAQLQRLPGLTQRESEIGSRSFVDLDMLGALQGGAFARHALAGFPGRTLSPLAELSEKAVAMAAHVLLENQAGPETIVSIAEQLQRRSQRDQISSQMIADCLIVAIRIAIDQEIPTLDTRGLIIDGACLDRIPLDEVQLLAVTFRNCTIREIAFGNASQTGKISFANCIIGKVCGVANQNGLPLDIIGKDCEIQGFDNMATNSAVLQLDIAPQLKALVTVLRKLYKQPGTGRKLTALSRGITHAEVQKYIEPVISLLQRNQFISIFDSVVHPVRKQSHRVEAILSSPTLTTDPIALEARAL